MPIENVSDTARWVAVYRAMESERVDAIFHDPFARRLAGKKGEEILEGMKEGRAMAWALIVRTAVMDELILDAIGRGGVDTIVNLAAGLDARPWRLAVPATLRWVDVDLPAILEYKRGIIGEAKPRCDYGDRTGSDGCGGAGALFARIGANSRRAIVVINNVDCLST